MSDLEGFMTSLVQLMLKRSVSIAILILKPCSTFIMLFHFNRKFENYEKLTDVNLFEIIWIYIQNAL